MSPCYGHTCLTLSYFTEGAGAFDDPVSVGVDIYELAEIFRDSRGIDDKSLLDILWDCGDIVFIMDPYTFFYELSSQL